MTTYTWNTGTGDWASAASWAPTGGPPDAATAGAVITRPGSYTVTIGSDSVIEHVTANSVTLDATGATLTIGQFGTLSLGGTSPTLFLNAGTFDLAGTLAGGTVVSNGASVVLDGSSNPLAAAELDGVTWRGALVLAAHSDLRITGGLTVETLEGGSPGLIDLSAGSASLNVLDSETLNNAVLNFGSVGANYLYNNYQFSPVGHTLTLGSGFTITAEGNDFSYNYLANFHSSDTIVNAGTIEDINGLISIYGGTFHNTGSAFVGGGGVLDFAGVASPAKLINSGSITIGPGGNLLLGTGFSNTGSIAIGSGGVLTLEGSVTLAELQGPGHISNNGGTLVVDGLLDLQGGTLDATATGLFSNVIVDFQGTLANGTVKLDGGNVALSNAPFGNGPASSPLLSGVTWQGPLKLAAHAGLLVSDGLIVQSAGGGGLPGYIDLTAGSATLYTINDETLDNATLDFGSFGNNALYNYDPNFVGNTLTLGTGFTITMSGGLDALYNYIPSEFAPSNTIVNAGTIDVAGGKLQVQVGTLRNTGIALVSNGELDLSEVSLINSGGILIGSGGDVTLGAGAVSTGSIVIAGGTLELTGSTAASVRFGGSAGLLQIGTTYTGTIYNFVAGDTIDLVNVPYQSNGTTTLLSGNTLQVIEGSTTVDLRLDPAQNFSGLHFQTQAGRTAITVICFLAGTHIATDQGEVLVENLEVGDKVRTLGGAYRRITWIGAGRHLATPGRRDASTPVVVCKGALAANIPHHDLRVTKAHSLYFDGVLIPVEFLVNHRSIRWDDRARGVTLYHIELETHDILLANGAPAESYRDDGNRWLFQNGHTGWHLPPQEPCAPVLTGGPIVDRLWRRLLDLAGPRPGLPLTDDPDLHLLLDGQRLDGARTASGAWMFRLPTRPQGILAGAVRIKSRAASPQELGIARDPRVLGVALRRIAIDEGRIYRIVEANDPALSEGTYEFEPDQGFRWTNGEAVLPEYLFDGFTGPVDVFVHVACTGSYVDSGEVRGAA